MSITKFSSRDSWLFVCNPLKEKETYIQMCCVFELNILGIVSRHMSGQEHSYKIMLGKIYMDGLIKSFPHQNKVNLIFSQFLNMIFYLET